MDYFSKFSTVADYNSAKSSLDLPHVSLIEGTREVYYDQ